VFDIEHLELRADLPRHHGLDIGTGREGIGVGSGQDAFDRCKKLIRLDRLAHVVVHTLFQAQLAVTLHGIRRHRNDGQMLDVIGINDPRPTLLARADGSRGFDTAHDRHLNVHQHQIEVLALDQIQRFLPIGRNGHTIACALKCAHCDQLIHRVVLGEQYVPAPVRPQSLVSQRTLYVEIADRERKVVKLKYCLLWMAPERLVQRGSQFACGKRLEQATTYAECARMRIVGSLIRSH
jgi:hypothetical protein